MPHNKQLKHCLVCRKVSFHLSESLLLVSFFSRIKGGSYGLPKILCPESAGWFLCMGVEITHDQLRGIRTILSNFSQPSIVQDQIF